MFFFFSVVKYLHLFFIITVSIMVLHEPYWNCFQYFIHLNFIFFFIFLQSSIRNYLNPSFIYFVIHFNQIKTHDQMSRTFYLVLYLKALDYYKHMFIHSFYKYPHHLLGFLKYLYTDFFFIWFVNYHFLNYLDLCLWLWYYD